VRRFSSFRVSAWADTPLILRPRAPRASRMPLSNPAPYAHEYPSPTRFHLPSSSLPDCSSPAPVDTTAQNLPGWAEPSEQRQSRFESRSFDTQENRYQSNRSRRAPQNGINTSFPGATTNCNGNGNCDNGNGGGNGNGAGNGNGGGGEWSPGTGCNGCPEGEVCLLNPGGDPVCKSRDFAKKREFQFPLTTTSPS
jgi:hypothetical protein